jgi:two-component sensor histidine kinase
VYLLLLLKQLVLLLCIGAVSTLNGSSIKSEANADILTMSQVLVTDANATPKSVTQTLKPYRKSTVNSGMCGKQIWVAIPPSALKNLPQNTILYLSSPLMERVTIYKSSGNSNYTLVKKYDYFKRDHSSPYIHFKVDKASPASGYLLHIEPLAMPVDFAIKAASKKDFETKSLHYIVENVALLGFILALALYSFFIFFFTEDKSYVYYSLYLFFLIWHQITYVGITALFVPYSFVLFDSQVTNLKIGLIILASILYAIHFLKVQKGSLVYKLYLAYFVLVIATVAVAATIGLNADLIVVIAMFYVLFNFTAGVLSYRRGVKEARLFIAGFGVVALCYIAAILDALGFISVIEAKPNIVLYATALEALILSIAFADRYMILQKEKQKLTVLRLKESTNRAKIIEQKVEEKTEKLDVALKAKEMLIKEVHHRVKNNLQIILSMLRIQIFKSSNSEVKKQLQDLEHRINAIAKSYEMLLITENIEKIDMKSYIKALIDDIAQAYNFKQLNIKVVRDIEAIIPLKQAVYIGLIVNELIANAYEHGEPTTEQSIIFISFKRVDDIYKLIVDDNCSGVIPTKREEFGMGLKFIDALVRNQLEGSYTIDKKRVTIRLKL